MHYASILKHVISNLTWKFESILKVYRYPLAEDSIHAWTNLDRTLIFEGDRVVLGIVSETEKLFDTSFERISSIETEYYTSNRYRTPVGIVNLLGTKFSFWGSISAKLVSQICRLSPKEIIYIGKLGALTTQNDLYTRIFCPSEYLTMYHQKLISRVTNLNNGILEKYPEISTKAHVSVPTILEEDYLQRTITDHLNVSSIDNEISQMAFSIYHQNLLSGKNISFSSLHFATDYIRRESEKGRQTKFDLSNNRTTDALNAKSEILAKINQLLLKYFNENT